MNDERADRNDVFSFRGRIGRRAYVGIALAGVFLKHVVDAIVAWSAFGRPWMPLNYLMPLGIPVRLTAMSANDRTFLLAMVAVSLPFAVVGVAITAKRFRTIGWPLRLVPLFFVPIANLVTFAVAAVAPDVPDLATEPGARGWLHWVPSDRFGAAFVALVVPATLAGVIAVAGVEILNGYGWGLFVALPFTQGMLAALVFEARQRRPLGATLGVAALSVLLLGCALVAVAFEGFGCVLMALPLALAFAVAGAWLGHVLTGTRASRGSAATLTVLVLFAPCIMGAEAALPREPTTYAVRTAIVVNAPPDRVWRDVVRFPDLPTPSDPLFRSGIAYPIRARIEGTGVGAIRRCEFSTGDFVEPITAWAPGRLLAFDVTRNPPPMREWSPYGAILTPHLHGYLIARRGQFALEVLPGGRTRLIGTTWYQHRLWPESYWAVFADAIIHRIHLRVLGHIKALAER